MPTVLFLNLYASLGGAENALLHLLGALDRSRVRPLVVVGRDGPLVGAVRERGVEARVVPFPSPPLWRIALPWVLFREARAAWRLRQLARETGAQVLHVGDVLGLLLAIPARMAGARVVYQVNYRGGWPRTLLMNALVPMVAQRVLVFSEAQRAELLAHTVGLSSRLHAVAPGIGADALRPAPRPTVREALGLPADAPIVGMVARYDAWKGHRVFLRAAARLVARRRDLRIVLVGGALNEEDLPHVADCREAVRADLRALGLEDKVLVLGFVPRSADVIAALDVLVCPSENEPFGMVVVEALALGTPVVVADSGGPPEIVDHGRCGLIFATADDASLADQVLRLLEDEPLRRSLAAAGRDRARTAFTSERYARALEAVYQGLA